MGAVSFAIVVCLILLGYTKYTRYTWYILPKSCTIYVGDTMKKTEFISFRTDQSTKALLGKIAAERKWSVSQLVELIIKERIQHTFLIEDENKISETDEKGSFIKDEQIESIYEK